MITTKDTLNNGVIKSKWMISPNQSTHSHPDDYSASDCNRESLASSQLVVRYK